MTTIIKEINGKKRYYVEINCRNCGKKTLYDKYLIKRKGYGFCLNNPYCVTEFYHKQKDPKLANILQHINKANFCYLIGLIVADGHITYPSATKGRVGHECSIELEKTDLKLLKNIQNNFGGRIYKLKNNMHRLTMYYKPFVEYLKKEVGLTHNKTHNIKINNWFLQLSDKNKNHFLRGLIDGDGCIRKGKNGTWYFTLTMSAKNFIQLIKQYFKKQKYNICYYENNNKKHYTIAINGKYIIKPIKRIYKVKDELVMERKYLKVQQLLREKT